MVAVSCNQLEFHNKSFVIFNMNGFCDNSLKAIADALKSEFFSAKNGIIN